MTGAGRRLAQRPGRVRRRPRRPDHRLAVVVPRRRRGRPPAGRRRASSGSTRPRPGRPPGRGRPAYVVRDGAVIAWVVPAGAGRPRRSASSARTPTRPSFKLKPRPTTGSHGWLQAGVEVYGGPLLNSWLDRELELAGRLVTRDGAEHLVRTGPLLRIPQLAIHLDRAASTTASPSTAAAPAARSGGSATPTSGDLIAHLAGLAGVDADDVAGWDLSTADTAPPAAVRPRRRAVRGRPHGQPQPPCTPALAALLAARRRRDRARPRARRLRPRGDRVGVAIRRGGPVPRGRARAHRSPGSAPTTRTGARAFAGSWLLSSDAGHAVHPNYPERHDPANRPVLGGGPLLKVNANQRYATDGAGARAVGARLPQRRRAGAGVRLQQRHARAAPPSARSPRPGSASAPSTSACRCCRCTRRASSRTSTTCGARAAITAFYRGV